MRSLREETKFHQMCRGPSIGAPPTSTTRASARRRHRDGVAGTEHQQLSGRELVAGDVDLAVDDIDRALLGRRHRAASSRRPRASPPRTACPTGSAPATARRRLPATTRTLLAVAGDDRQLVAATCAKPGVISSSLGRQRHPALQAVQRLAVDAVLRRGALGMHDAAAGGHPVDLAGPDRHGGAEAVAVHDLAVEQVGHGGEPDMRMRPHVDALAALNSAGPK